MMALVLLRLLKFRRDNKFDDFMGPIVADFEKNFDLAFGTWMTTDKDNYSTRGFLMAGPQNEGAPNP